MRISKLIYLIALVVLIIGGINWGLVGLFNFDLVAFLFGTLSTLSRIIYSLVGLSAIYIAITTLMTHDIDISSPAKYPK